MLLNPKISIYSEERAAYHAAKSQFSNQIIDLHEAPQLNIGGDYHVLFGFIIYYVFDKFADFALTEFFKAQFDIIKEKIYITYTKIRKNEKTKIFNFVFKIENKTLMYVFPFDLTIEEFDKRYEGVKNTYNHYIELAEDNYPLVLSWDEKLHNWSVPIDEF